MCACGQRKTAENEINSEQTSSRPKRCTEWSRNCLSNRKENMAVRRRGEEMVERERREGREEREGGGEERRGKNEGMREGMREGKRS